MNPKSRFVAWAIAATTWTVSMSLGAETRAPEAGAPSQGEADELGMAKELGPATWARCAAYLSNPDAKAYELSHVRSNTMPLSPFAGPFELTYLPSAGVAGSKQAFNVDVVNENASPGQQGTQMDALGHFAYLDEAWDGTSAFSTDGAHYYGGFIQKDVKPTPDSPLLKLGMEKVPPVVTTAILLDAKKHVGGGKAMNAGEVVTSQHIEEMLRAQGLGDRGILAGDVVLVYTGWSDHYKDPDTDKVYYSKAPGLSYDAAKYLGDRRVVAAGLDTPFVDTVAEGMLQGNAPPPPGTPEGLAFPIHHYLLTQAGIHTLENLKLDELARDGVSTSCTIVLPLREKGSAGSPIRPVAIGVPGR
ncbi:MAG TPA: cyclase family protein [Vicinamibacteria bacterium]|nr:cyclase family protein [Vicinamibacteria bacterium]